MYSHTESSRRLHESHRRADVTVAALGAGEAPPDGGGEDAEGAVPNRQVGGEQPQRAADGPAGAAPDSHARAQPGEVRERDIKTHGVSTRRAVKLIKHELNPMGTIRDNLRKHTHTQAAYE